MKIKTGLTAISSMILACAALLALLTVPLGMAPVDGASDSDSGFFGLDEHYLTLIIFIIATAVGCIVTFLIVRKYPGVEDGTVKRPLIVKYLDSSYYLRIIIAGIGAVTLLVSYFIGDLFVLDISIWALLILSFVDISGPIPILTSIMFATMGLTGLVDSGYTDIIFFCLAIALIVLIAVHVHYFRNGGRKSYRLMQALIILTIVYDIITIALNFQQHVTADLVNIVLNLNYLDVVNLVALVIILYLLNRPDCKEFFSIGSKEGKGASQKDREDKSFLQRKVRINNGESDSSGSRPHPGYIVSPVADILFERGYISKDRAAYDFTNSRTFQDYVNNPSMAKMTPKELADLFEKEQNGSGFKV